MSAISRGVKNSFRNPIRTISVTAILGLSLGMVVVMLAARSAVDNRIAEVKRTVGNTVTISPAGARGFLGGGEPLTTAQLNDLAAMAHVSSVDATIDAQLRPAEDTSLASPIDAGTLGRRQAMLFEHHGVVSGNGSANTPASVPILVIGTNNATYGGAQVGNLAVFSDGKMFDASSDANVAAVGKSLADKNSLTVGSTFTAYGKTIAVSGIYDAGNQFANNSVIFPLKTLQTLSSQTDQITAMAAHIDSVDNLAAVTSSVTTKLGSTADVSSSEETVKESIKPLENIRTIAATSLIGALVAAAIITLLTMVMIVRERRKEIAVLKAIGASDGTIVTQFVTESVMLSLLGSVVGTALGFVLSNPILKALLTSSTSSGGTITAGGPGDVGGRAGGAVRFAVGGFRAVQSSVRNLEAVVDWHLILYGVVAALVVAIVGSAFPAWLIGKVRPAEVLRSE